MRSALAVAVLLSACGSKAKPSTPAPAAPAAVVVTLKALENGDRACYVVVESAQGEQSIEGAFELCEGGSKDATALIGKPVTYTTTPARVQAAACGGDPECPDSDEVDLVTSISPAR